MVPASMSELETLKIIQVWIVCPPLRYHTNCCVLLYRQISRLATEAWCRSLKVKVQKLDSHPSRSSQSKYILTYIIMFQVKVEDGKIFVTVNKSVSASQESEWHKINTQTCFPGCVVNPLFVSWSHWSWRGGSKTCVPGFRRTNTPLFWSEEVNRLTSGSWDSDRS